MKLDPEATISLKCRELIKLLNINLNHFPRHEKYGLCQEIRQAVYALRHGSLPSLVSVLGNARYTATYRHFCRRILSERPDLVSQLPE